MRHRIGMILAVIMAGVLFFPGAWGYLRLLRFPAPVGQLSRLPADGGSLISDYRVLIALAAIAGAGLLAGILIAVPWISPLAAGLPGLLLLGWTGLYLASARRAVELIPLRSGPFGTGFEAMLFNGILGAAGMAMILPLLVPSRWRPRGTDESEAAGADEFIAILDGSAPGETTEAVPGGQTGQPTRLSPIATSAHQPASSHHAPDPVVAWPRPSHARAGDARADSPRGGAVSVHDRADDDREYQQRQHGRQ
jgi:hypothetical protein